MRWLAAAAQLVSRARVGLWPVMLAVGAALAGYPLFGWLDPLVIFNAAFGAARRRLELRDWLAAAGLPALLLLAFLAPGLWCGRLCPLGALQDLIRFPFRLRMLVDKTARRRESAALGRRAFLGLGLGAGYRLVLRPVRGGTSEAAIRPPASTGDARFTRLCTRCGACVRSCPSGIIRFGGVGNGWVGVLAPEVSFDNGYCRLPAPAAARSARAVRFRVLRGKISMCARWERRAWMRIIA